MILEASEQQANLREHLEVYKQHALVKANPSHTFIKLQDPLQGIIVTQLHTIVQQPARVL